MVSAKSTTMCKKSLKIHDTRKCFLLVMSILFEKKTSHEGTTQHRNKTIPEIVKKLLKYFSQNLLEMINAK